MGFLPQYANQPQPWSAAFLSQLGLQGENFPPYLAGQGGAAFATAGKLYMVQIPLFGTSITVTNLRYTINAAGGTLTAGQCFIGLLDNVGNQIGWSADQAAAWASTGAITTALVGGPFTGNWPFVYVAAYFNGTTGPGFARGYQGTGAPTSVILGSSGANMPTCTNGAGFTTTPPASVSYANNAATATPQLYWAGLS